MFDDWAYQEVYALQPTVAPSAPTPAPTSQKQTRDRSVSIVRSVAQSRLEIELPAPELRQRAQSLSSRSTKEPEKPTETPLTHSEAARLWDRRKWLGSAYDPELLGFDEPLWGSRVAAFTEVRSQARLAARIAHEQQTDAQAQLQQISWISHELRDIEEHDISPLLQLASRLDALVGKRALISQVKGSLSEVYDALDRIVRILRGPAPRAVPKLPGIFEEIDVALAFCTAHPDFAQISQTAQGLRNCEKRALDIAKAYSVHELRKITERVHSKMRANPGAAQALVYAKFEADAAHCEKAISLVADHSMRAGRTELANVFTELQNEYFGLRMHLIGNEAARFAEPLLAFTQLNDPFFDAARSAMVQFKQLFSAEQRLFVKLFGKVTPELGNWLVDLCDPLYSALRRLIVRETDVGRLCQLIVLVHNESDDASEDAENKSLQLLPTVDPFQQVYGDAQQRLVFRADLIIDGFSSYTPSAKDFNRARFPVVDQALGLLSQVYQLLNTQVFNDLAHRCIRECVAALDFAVANRVASGGLSGAPKVHLFHIKQLLILQSQIVEFDLEHTILHEVDFSGIRRLLELPRGYSFRELLSLAWDSVPQVVEYMFDAMEELYASLRRAVDRLCASLVAQSAAALQGKKGAAKDKAAKFRDTVSAQFSELKPAIAEHIGDPRVASVLLDSAQEAIVSQYAEFYNSASIEEKNEHLMDPEMFIAWVSSTIAEGASNV